MVEIINELVKHGHNKTKRMENGKSRNKAQSKKELLEHYKDFHYNK